MKFDLYGMQNRPISVILADNIGWPQFIRNVCDFFSLVCNFYLSFVTWFHQTASQTAVSSCGWCLHFIMALKPPVLAFSKWPKSQDFFFTRGNCGIVRERIHLSSSSSTPGCLLVNSFPFGVGHFFSRTCAKISWRPSKWHAGKYKILSWGLNGTK